MGLALRTGSGADRELLLRRQYFRGQQMIKRESGELL